MKAQKTTPKRGDLDNKEENNEPETRPNIPRIAQIGDECAG